MTKHQGPMWLKVDMPEGVNGWSIHDLTRDWPLHYRQGVKRWHDDPTIQRMLDDQWGAQCEYYGTAPDQLVGERRSDYVRTMALAMHDEIGEALQEIAWKPWSSDQVKFNREAFQQELIDALFFWINLWLVTGDDADELMDMFRYVTEKNRARRADGYDARKDEDGRQLDAK